MAEITLKGLGHSYKPAPASPGDYAVRPVDMTWEDGKTYALLGPSGCGKTTMLNMISGLLEPSDGQLFFDGREVTRASTAERNIAQVFQFPVIYTTKSVRQNLAFPLQCRGRDPASIARRVAEIADLLDLGAILDAPARRLRADQKQLISLGRGLVREDVSAVLLDEPLTVIDPQLKFGLRRKLREINRATGIIMILVTHDQSEAMSFADEIVLMKDGGVQQSGPPEELFARPSNEFVGYFIGSPPLNLFPAERRDGRLICAPLGVELPDRADIPEGPVNIGVRPEHLELHPVAPMQATAIVERVENLGVDRVFTLQADGGAQADGAPQAGAAARIKVKSRKNRDLTPGSRIGFSVEAGNLLVFHDGKLVHSG